MWPYNETENAFVGGIAAEPSPFKRGMTASEIDFTARRLRAMMIGELLADLLIQAGRTLAWLASPLATWWNHTRVYDELMSMDDRMLADIGISRADIPAVAGGARRNLTIDDSYARLLDSIRLPRPAMIANDDHAAPRVA